MQNTVENDSVLYRLAKLEGVNVALRAALGLPQPALGDDGFPEFVRQIMDKHKRGELVEVVEAFARFRMEIVSQAKNEAPKDALDTRALVKRIETTDCGSASLDCDVFKALGYRLTARGRVHGETSYWLYGYPTKGSVSVVPEVTSRLVCISALIKHTLPHHRWTLEGGESVCRAMVYPADAAQPSEPSRAYGYGYGVAQALCAAFLRRYEANRGCSPADSQAAA